MLERLKEGWRWFQEHAEGRYAKFWLVTLSFAESSFFVIPPDPLLAAIILAGSQRWLYYSFITTLASVGGALFGYLIGAFFFSVIGAPLVAFYGLEEQLAVVQGYFNSNTFIVLFFGAFTPIPLKVFVLSGGFLKVNLISFLLGTFVGRMLRYGAIAYAVHVFGAKALVLAGRYTTAFTIVSIALFVVYVLYTLFMR